MITPLQQLDDGWPESAEQQGLLLLVLRYYITRQYIKDVLKVDKTSASIAGFGNTGPLSSTERKGKDCYDQEKQIQRASFGFVLGAWN